MFSSSHDRVAIRRVLVSVSDKTGLPTLLQALDADVTIYSTGGTFKTIQALIADKPGPALVRIEDYTEYPEMPGGLVKTLHPRIHGGLLADLGDEAQLEYLNQHGILPFDLVVVNLYPFESAANTPGATRDEVRAQIDIGGPTMLRAAAKNFPRVAVTVAPEDYAAIAAELLAHQGSLSYETRFKLAGKAFQHVAAYDVAIDRWFAKQNAEVSVVS